MYRAIRVAFNEIICKLFNPICIFLFIFRVFIAIVVGGMHSGRTMSNSMDFKKGQVAASRLFQVIETQPEINAEADEGEKPVSMV